MTPDKTSGGTRRRTWRLHVLARSIGYGYAALLPFLLYGTIGGLLSPGVDSLWGTDNPLFVVPIGLGLNTPVALIIAGILIIIIYTTELLAQRSRLIAYLLLAALFLVPVVHQIHLTATDPRIDWERFFAFDFPTLLILYIAATWEITQGSRISAKAESSIISRHDH